MRHVINFDPTDQVKVYDDWGYPQGIQFGDTVMYLTGAAIRKLQSALFALETEREVHQADKYDEDSVIDFAATEGRAS